MNALQHSYKYSDKAIDDLLKEVERLKADATRILMQTPEQAIEALRSPQFGQEIRRAMSKTYEDIATESMRAFRVQYPSLLFTDEMIAQIQALQKINQQTIEDIAAGFRRDIDRISALGQVGILPREMMNGELLTIFERGFATKIAVEIETGTSAFYQTVNASIAEAVGIDKYEYFGPVDERTRDFCMEHVGQIKTRAEWQAIDNGQNGAVYPFRGGYNCRHQLIPVLDEEKE